MTKPVKCEMCKGLSYGCRLRYVSTDKKVWVCPKCRVKLVGDGFLIDEISDLKADNIILKHSYNEVLELLRVLSVKHNDLEERFKNHVSFLEAHTI